MSPTDTKRGMSPSTPAPREFDVNDLQTRGIWAKFAQWLFDEPHWLFWLFRQFWPIPKFGNWALVTRYDDVEEVLRRDDVFQVPFTDKVRTLDGDAVRKSDGSYEDRPGPNFLLGMEPRRGDQARGDQKYWHCQKLVMQAFSRDDVAKVVAPLAAELSMAILAGAVSKRLDAIEELITRVPILICERYYGVPIANYLEFGQWTIAMSTYMFGDPSNDPRCQRAALAAGDRVRAVVDAAISQAKKNARKDTVLDRLLRMQQGGAQDLDDKEIRAYLIGMMTGFVPTNTMAAGHMLEMLLRRSDFMDAAREAARADDDNRLARCLFEAMRFMPLNPGPFRVCSKDYVVAAGTRRQTTIKQGMNLLAGTESAMFDGRRVERPRSFNPDRLPTDYMLFGHGLHWCVGAFIAQAQITQTFKALLKKDGLRRARRNGKLQLIGPFPAHLWVEFD